MKGFDDGTCAAEAALETPSKRGRYAERIVEEVDDSNARQLAWVRRGRSEPTGKVPWKNSKEVYRVAAKNTLVDMDNQIRQTTPLPGLQAFQRNLALAMWQDSQWRLWRHANSGHDLGSECVCASFVAEFLLELNYTKWPDIDHGCQRSFFEMLKSAGLYCLFLLLAVSWSFPCGPSNNDYRHHQLSSMAACARKKFTARTCALFQERCPDMRRELQEMGIDLPGLKDADLEVWDLWCDRRLGRLKGERLFNNRFMQCVDKPAKEVKYWTWDLFEREMLGLELGLLSSKKYSQKMIMRAKDAEIPCEGGGSTDSKRIHIDDKVLRSFAEEAISLSVAVLAEPMNKRIVEMMVAVGGHLKDDRTEGARNTRSVSSTRDYLVQQASGGFMERIFRSLMCLLEYGYLVGLRFAMPRFGDHAKIDEVDVEVDEDFAKMLFTMHISMAKARLVRALYYFAPPWCMVACLHSPATAKMVLLFFKDVWEGFNALRALANKTKIEARLLARHLCHLVVNQQYYHACLELGFHELGADLKDVLEQHFSACVSTTLCEEQVGMAKNNREHKVGSRYRTTDCTLYRLIQSPITQTDRFKFDLQKD